MFPPWVYILILTPLLVNKSINEIKARNIFGKVKHEVLPGSEEDLKILEKTSIQKDKDKRKTAPYYSNKYKNKSE